MNARSMSVHFLPFSAARFPDRGNSPAKPLWNLQARTRRRRSKKWLNACQILPPVPAASPSRSNPFVLNPKFHMPDIAFSPAKLFTSGERLPAIKSWLLESLWTSDRYRKLSPEQYLRGGEEAVCQLEELLSVGALEVWNELEADSQRAPTIKSWLGLDEQLPLTNARAAVVFDGLSLREIPLLVQMAESSGLKIKSRQAIATSLPTGTKHFVDERVLGARIGPSQLRGRTELATKN